MHKSNVSQLRLLSDNRQLTIGGEDHLLPKLVHAINQATESAQWAKPAF